MRHSYFVIRNSTHHLTNSHNDAEALLILAVIVTNSKSEYTVGEIDLYNLNCVSFTFNRIGNRYPL